MWDYFVLIAKCICSNCKMYLSKLQNVFVQITKCICPYNILFLSKFHNEFVQIKKIFVSKFENIFVKITKYICPNCKIYLSKLQNIFVKIRKVARFIFQISKCKFPNFIATLMASIASSHSGIPPFVADPQGQFLRRAIFRGQILVPILRGEPELTQNWFF